MISGAVSVFKAERTQDCSQYALGRTRCGRIEPLALVKGI